jgi:3-hydroxyisobutyrate dehydrogenase-like beta-hydroxyacid dehydrogenase
VIAFFGAGGKTGSRLTGKFLESGHRVLHVEISPQGREWLANRGVTVVVQEQAAREADIIVLAVPDRL